MINSSVLQAIGKFVPIGVGLLLTWLASSLNIVIDPSSQAGLVALCVAVLTAAWYLLVKVIVRYFPWTAVLIGDNVADAKAAKAARLAKPTTPMVGGS